MLFQMALQQPVKRSGGPRLGHEIVAASLHARAVVFGGGTGRKGDYRALIT